MKSLRLSLHVFPIVASGYLLARGASSIAHAAGVPKLDVAVGSSAFLAAFAIYLLAALFVGFGSGESKNAEESVRGPARCWRASKWLALTLVLSLLGGAMLAALVLASGGPKHRSFVLLFLTPRTANCIAGVAWFGVLYWAKLTLEAIGAFRSESEDEQDWTTGARFHIDGVTVNVTSHALDAANVEVVPFVETVLAD